MQSQSFVHPAASHHWTPELAVPGLVAGSAAGEAGGKHAAWLLLSHCALFFQRLKQQSLSKSPS